MELVRSRVDNIVATGRVATLRSARTLGLTVPPSVLARADKVIE